MLLYSLFYVRDGDEVYRTRFYIGVKREHSMHGEGNREYHLNCIKSIRIYT